jgi:hypothetical protein
MQAGPGAGWRYAIGDDGGLSVVVGTGGGGDIRGGLAMNEIRSWWEKLMCMCGFHKQRQVGEATFEGKWVRCERCGEWKFEKAVG